MDFTNKKIKINSPRSKKVLLALGLDENKLYEISKKEYIDSHPELKQASEEVQDKRYEHFNNRRIKAIEDAKKARQELIEELEKNNDKNQEEEVAQSTQEELIKKELEKLELIKKQQIGEIKNMIEYEYNQKEAYKKNKRKEKEREEKELKKKEERQKIEKERELKKKEELEKKMELKKKKKKN